MAKKTYRKRYYRSRGKWSANIRQIEDQSFNTGSTDQAYFFNYIDLCTNPTQQTSSVSQQFTVKNVELSYEIVTPEVSLNFVNGLTVYIMYLPQGMTVANNYHIQHPEYIMAHRYLGAANYVQSNPGRLPAKIKTRLSRRLQTGDKIIFYIVGYHKGTTSYTIQLHGLVRWWTKAN